MRNRKRNSRAGNWYLAKPKAAKEQKNKARIVELAAMKKLFHKFVPKGRCSNKVKKLPIVGFSATKVGG
ncbi:unnamed protein product [marine sediment metagenome]|uniref:Uncharacterized protein n=1 Tax=marine sediment metagenome TaxID=412755 RepID=X1T3F3_9ZZZZ